MLIDELDEIFTAGGTLAQKLDNYVERPAQLQLAQAILAAIDSAQVLIAEAGTGTGKTWAYLAPVFLSGDKALISTGTRNLQDQLYQRDIPNLRQALALPVKVALLKGRSNYVCHYHLQRTEQDERSLHSRTEVKQLRQIREFANISATGDKAELASVPETAEIWSRVTSTRENCLGQECPFVKECFVYKARRQAQEADVVVVNHALFMADLALREDGITDLLPEVKTVVFDEAHQLPDTATQFLGSHLSLHQVLDLVKQAQVAGLAHAREATNWSDLAKSIETAALELRLQAGSANQLLNSRVTFENITNADNFDQAYIALLASLQQLQEILKNQAERHPDIQAALNSCEDFCKRLLLWFTPARGESDPDPDKTAVRWLEYTRQSLRLHRVPLSVAKIFSSFRQDNQSWIFTSATLSVRGDYSHFQQQLGLDEAQTISFNSPFDYGKQAMLYVPDDLPWPNHADFLNQFTDTLLPLIANCSGGVLILCTTLRAIDIVSERLRAATQVNERLIMAQGEGSRSLLLDRFRQNGKAVLVGSTSFWEGVDIPGAALSLVAIDKLPFAPPDDPVLQARLNMCRASGGNPFMQFQLPHAALLLKQGAGRLIRNEQDSGLLMVGDGRLVDKPYGKLLWRGLPPFARTRDINTACDFLAQCNN